MESGDETEYSQPPRLLEKLLRWSLPIELQEPVLGDLTEEYNKLLVTQPNRATYWYTRQVLQTSLQFLTKTKRGLIMFLFSVLIFLGFVGISMLLSGNFWTFINVPSFLIVVPPAMFFTFACSSKPSIKNAFEIILSERTDFEKTELMSAKQVFNMFGNTNMLMGWIGLLTGGIAMGSSINANNVSNVFGPAFAVCLLTLFYALVIKALCYAAEAKIQFKIINLTS